MYMGVLPRCSRCVHYLLCIWVFSPGDLSVGLERLKEMGLSMNDELNRQDATIDRLTTKTERNHLVLQDQNSQMRKLLK